MSNGYRVVLNVIMLIGLACSGCYAAITGKVIDAETNRPIDGAVVLVEWTKTKGVPGMTATESYKVVEVLSDKDGKVTVSGVFNPLVNPPHITIYKKGYVAWNNEYIFPDYKKRTDFKWEKGYMFRLEKFKVSYSKEDHHNFMIHGILNMSLEKTPLFFKAESGELEEVLREKRKSNSTK